MNNGLILIAVLLIVLIYFVMQIPRKHANHKSEVVYVNRSVPPLERAYRMGKTHWDDGPGWIPRLSPRLWSAPPQA